MNKILKFDCKTITLFKNMFLSFGIKGMAIFISLMIMPLYMDYFKEEKILGVWFTIISILSWVLTFDLGIANGLRNNLVKPIIEKNFIEIKKYISSAYLITAIISIIIYCIGSLLISTIDWNKLLNIEVFYLDNDTILFVVKALFFSIMLNFFLKIVNSVYFAMQKSFVPSLLLLLNSILVLLFLLFYNGNNHVLDIKVLAIINIIATNLPIAIATIYVFIFKYKAYAPSISYCEKKYVLAVLSLGGEFFWIQIMTLILFGTNEFFITTIVNPKYVIDFQIYNKIFMLVCTLFNLSLTPVWSAIREACVKNDVKWIKSLYKNLNLVIVGLIPIEILIGVSFEYIIKLWIGENNIQISWYVIVLFIIYNTMYMKLAVNSSIVSGLGNLKKQIIASTISVFIKLCFIMIINKINCQWHIIVLINIISLAPYLLIEHFDLKNQLANIKEVTMEEWK